MSKNDCNFAREELKKASDRFIETVLTDKAVKGSSDEILDRNIEGWTQFTMITDAFAARAFSLPCFTRPFVSFVLISMENIADEWLANAKAEDFLQISDAHAWPLLHLCPLQVTRPFTRNIAGTRRSPERQKRKINLNQRVCTLSQALIGAPALRRSDTTHPC